MKVDKICDYIGIVAKYMARQGLSWSYSCVVETQRYTDTELGEGCMTIYYNGFDYPQSNHGRLSFCLEDDNTNDIYMLGSWGVQGRGEHYYLETIKNPSEQDIENTVKQIADYLRKVRIAISE